MPSNQQFKVINIPDGLPTPFKKLLHWPETTRTGIKKKVKVKLPSVAPSEQW